MNETKDTNPKAAFAANKVPLHLWPAIASAMGAMGLLDGACKYGRSNWRHSGVRASTYVDALARHANDWFEGNDIDPDSRLHQFCHMLACCAILVDAWAQGKLVDDRMYRGAAGHRAKMQELSKLVPEVRERYADKNPTQYDRRVEIEEDEADNKARAAFCEYQEEGEGFTQEFTQSFDGCQRTPVDL